MLIIKGRRNLPESMTFVLKPKENNRYSPSPHTHTHTHTQELSQWENVIARKSQQNALCMVLEVRQHT